MSTAPHFDNSSHLMENEDSFLPATPNRGLQQDSQPKHIHLLEHHQSSDKQKLLDENCHSSKHGWSKEDELLLYRLHDQIGNKWAIIAHKMSDRTDNCVKNHFYSKLRKALRKLNKGIHDCYRKEYKEIKMSAFYKIIQATQEGRKAHTNVEGSVSDYCKDLKNRLLRFADDFDEKSLQTLDGRQEAKCMIRQVVEFSRHYRRQSKKKRKSSGNDGTIYPLYFKQKPVAWEEHMSEQDSDDIFYSNSSKQSRKRKNSQKYEENAIQSQLYLKEQPSGKKAERINERISPNNIQDSLRAEGLVSNEEIPSPCMIRNNSKLSKLSARFFEQEPQLYYEDSLGISEKVANYTLFQHLIKPDGSQKI